MSESKYSNKAVRKAVMAQIRMNLFSLKLYDKGLHSASFHVNSNSVWLRQKTYWAWLIGTWDGNEGRNIFWLLLMPVMWPFFFIFLNNWYVAGAGNKWFALGRMNSLWITFYLLKNNSVACSESDVQFKKDLLKRVGFEVKE